MYPYLYPSVNISRKHCGNGTEMSSAVTEFNPSPLHLRISSVIIAHDEQVDQNNLPKRTNRIATPG